ncbi:MAG: hypothetical protein HY055_00415 [Magnetospirillum sp.]|nr:hypothetical protein [Magnetospirillum sp.]
MIKNPLARPFFEFLKAHDLSLYKVAKLSHISEGTLRSYRDVDGRMLTPHTMLPVANTLCHLTKEPIDLLYLFGDGSRRSDDTNANVLTPYKNEKFSDLLWNRRIAQDDLSSIANINDDYITALLNGETLPQSIADRISTALGVSPTDIGIYETVRDETEYYNSRHITPTTMTHNGDKYINLMHSEIWPNTDRDPDFPSSAIVIYDNLGHMVARPPGLVGVNSAFGLIVCFSDMAPRMEVGEWLYVNPDSHAHPGSDVLIEFKQTERCIENIAVVRRLCDYNANSVLVRRYNPSEYEEINNGRIKKIYKILRTQELISPNSIFANNHQT